MLYFIGLGGIFHAKDSNREDAYSHSKHSSPLKECYVKLLFISFFFESIKSSNLNILPTKVISKNIQSGEDEGLQNYLICEKIKYVPSPAGHEPELQYAEGTFMLESIDYYLVVYGVTRSNFIACCIVKRGRIEKRIKSLKKYLN